jgi:Response regulator of the LytR/AlgR family
MKIIIVEDESSAARRLELMLKGIVPDLQVLEVLESITDTVEWFNLNPAPDLVFMDIHLADGSAFEIFKRVDITAPIIFTTAYDEYALKAFKVNSIDYLVKPIDVKSVKKAIDKFQMLTSPVKMENNLQKLLESIQGTKPKYQTHFLIPANGDKLIPLPVKDIASIYIHNGIVSAFLFSRKSYAMENTLDELFSLLNPADFFRANRQYIIARSAVFDVDYWFGGRLSVNLVVPMQERIIISKLRAAEFKKWLSNS